MTQSDPLPGATAITEASVADVADAAGRAAPKTQASQLVSLAIAAGAVLFHTPQGEAFISIQVGGHRETWPVRSMFFQRWLRQLFWKRGSKAPGGQALSDAVGVLEGLALFGGDELPVFVRVAGFEGAIFLDLGDPEWRVVKVTSAGWEVVADSPVAFRRPRGMAALPGPVSGGNIADLDRFLNVSASERVLVRAWAVAAFRPVGPYPVLVLHGEQGSAKSTNASVLRGLIDPNVAPLRSEPRDGRDLMIAARNGWIVCFDNISSLPPWLSDGLCRLATGGGFATRELFSDAEELLIDAQRPLILNGIEELATRGDLLDRSLMLTLPGIGEEHRRAEEEFWREFEAQRSRLLGALLDAVATALRNWPDARLERLPRLADFALWSTAAEPALGVPAGTFAAAYDRNRAGAHEITLEAAPIADSVRAVARNGGFIGTASELLDELRKHVSDDPRRNGWPKSASALSGALRRIAPNLRAVGVEITFGVRLEGTRRGIRLEQSGNTASAASAVSDRDGADAPDGVLRVTSYEACGPA